MLARFDWGNGRGWVLTALGLTLLGCSGIGHDCTAARTCPEPNQPIDIGTGDSWWNGGSAGQAGDSTVQGSAGAADEAGASGEGGAAATEAPLAALSVVSVSPPPGAHGVRADTELVVVFSQAMDTAATVAAYESNDLPASQVTFSWDESERSLTVTPNAPLHYATNESSDSDVPAQVYRYGFSTQAQDRLGQALPAASFAFSTLRQISRELPADATRTGNWTVGEAEGINNCLRQPKAPYVPTVCVGDDAYNVRYSGFLSFDLSDFPPGIAEFSSARLVASAIVHGTLDGLGANHLEQVAFGEIGAAALGATAHLSLGSLLGEGNYVDKTQIQLSVDLTAAVAADYANRTARANLTQYRVGFSEVLANGHWDDIELPTNDIRLLTTYLVP